MTMTDVMGPIEAELREQRDFLARSYVEWVRREPRRANCACMVVRCLDASTIIELPGDAYVWLHDWMARSPVNWNDDVATRKEQVVAKLDEAIAVAREAGV